VKTCELFPPPSSMFPTRPRGRMGAPVPTTSDATPTMLRTARRLLLLGTAIWMPCAVTQAEETTPLRIITVNTEILTAPGVRGGQIERYRFNHGRHEHHERVADIIEVLQPDIVNLLEATSKESVDLVVKILHEKGLTDYQGYHVESN